DMDAWLTFLGCDEPKYISKLLETHPDFKSMYHDLYGICRNTERMMTMFFSEELKILDDNTVKYMMDQLEEEVKEKKAILAEQDKQLAKQDKQIAKQDKQIAEQDKQIAEQGEKIISLNAEIANDKAEIAELKAKLAEFQAQSQK
ncbi:MAG: hypothetical protein VZR06_14745, partial [Butyrivibrio sp.]|nr:hypothetical protein [Butyrivibrio sp.]